MNNDINKKSLSKFLTFESDFSKISSFINNEVFVDFENFTPILLSLLIKRILILNTKGAFCVYFKNRNWNKENLDLCTFLSKNDNFLFEKFFNNNFIFEICNSENRQVVRNNKKYKRIYNGNNIQ